MAEAAVSSALDNLRNILIEGGKFFYRVKDQVEEMRTDLNWMQSMLKKIEKRKLESDPVRNWVSDIVEAAYDAEDLMEGFVLRSALRNEKGVVNLIKKFAFSPNHAVELQQLSLGMGGINAKINALRAQFQICDMDDTEGAARRKMQEYPNVVDHNVVGLDEKIDELVQKLLDFEEAPVVCLYGMGGVGKTTAAKKVYYNHRIRVHFECFAWIYISQQSKARQVRESILTQISDSKILDVEKMSDRTLIEELCRLQKERRCLLVIDNVWRIQDWHKLCADFSYLEENNRSKILLTTRYRRIASSLGLNVYHTSLQTLDRSSSLELLKSTIFYIGGPAHPMKENSNMEKLAEEMVTKCKGLPQAIIELGGVLGTEHTLEDWQRVGANIKSVLKKEDQEGVGGVSSILELSYEDSSYSVRQCFLHFSQYPEDKEMKTTEIIQRWIAEGFVSSSMEDGDETMEEVAEKYLNELIDRCMVQEGRKGHTGRIKTCRMHGLIHDFCISKAEENGFAQSIKLGVENNRSFKTRRVSTYDERHSNDDSIPSWLVGISPRLRSLSWFRSSASEDSDRKIRQIINNLKVVRTIVDHHPLSNGTAIEHIGNLVHLRFLKIGLSNLPTSIGNLRYLQTLKLNSEDSTSSLQPSGIQIPNSLWSMVQLRHLYFPAYSKCESKVQQVGDFKKLLTLVNFPPEGFDLQQNLDKFRSVRKLTIVRSLVEIGEVLIRSQAIAFGRLQSLSLSGSGYVDMKAVTRACPRLRRLVVNTICTAIWPSNLTKLVLNESPVDESEMKTLAKLQSLKVLFLHRASFEGKSLVFHENDFPQLRHLSLQGLFYLEAWTVHEGGLPSLSSFEIDNCRKLKSIRDGFRYLEKLEEVRVKNMPDGFRRRLEKDRDRRGGGSHAPSIYFTE